MTITARNIGRINVWPSYDIARAADTAESEFVGQLTVWRTADEARANITHEEEGGGGAPAWVPENALIHIDLVHAFNDEDAAWVDGVGVVAVDTLLGSDPNTENGWGISEAYDPDDLSPNGYDTSDHYTAFLGALLSQVLAGTTLVLRTENNAATAAESTEFVMVSADGGASLAVETNISGDVVQLYSFADLEEEAAIIVNNGVEGAVNATAITTATGRLEACVNGSTALVGVVAPEDRPEGNPLVAVAVNTAAATHLRSITLYAALPSTAGLSELSEV